MAASAFCCVVLSLSLAGQDSGGAGNSGPRVILLGGSTTLSPNSPPGLGYTDWIREILDRTPGELGQTVRLIQAGREGGTVKEGREAARKHFAEKPDIFVLGFGLEDALRISPGEFMGEVEALVDEIARECPESKVLLVTSTPLNEGHPRAREERFRSAGGIAGYQEKNFVEPLRALARKRSLPLADHHALFQEALLGGEPTESLVRKGGAELTGRGNLLAGRSTAQSILELLRPDTGKPEPKEIPARDKAAGLEPFLEVWARDLEPLWLDRYRSKDLEIRMDAMNNLLQEESLPADFLTTLLALLTQSGETRQTAMNLLFQAIRAKKVDRDEVVAELFSRLRKEGLNSLTALTVLPIIEEIVAGQSSRPSSRTRSVPTMRSGAPLAIRRIATTRTPREPRKIPPYRFTKKDLSLLESASESQEERIRTSATRILLAPPGEPGLEMILGKVKTSSGDRALEFLAQIQNWYPLESLKDQFVEMARRDPREEVRRYCLNQVFSLRPEKIPLDILKELFLGEAGDTQERAAKLLASRGEESLDLFISSLQAAEEDQVWFSRLALLYMGVYGSSDAVGRKALSAVQEHFLPDHRKELLIYLEAAMQKMNLPRICISQPVRQPTTVRTRSIRRRPSPRSVQAGNWPVERNEVQVYRLAGFVPTLRTALGKGTDEEKEIAERILRDLWQGAVAIEGRLRRSEEPKTQQHFPEPISPELVELLEREAWSNLNEKGDSQGFLLRARQARTAGASDRSLNSFAWALATTWRNELWNPELAEEWVREAIARGGRISLYLDTLAASLAGQGKFQEALDLELEVLEKIKKEDNPAPFTARALRYLSRKPYRKKPPVK